jgi:Co/Zn/Cd efflux system component
VELLRYEDVQTLRNCCTFLHNFTRDLRLSWRLFPHPRNVAINLVVNLFVHWATVDHSSSTATASRLVDDMPLADERGEKICRRYLNLQCEDKHCPFSHAVVHLDRQSLHSRGAFLDRQDFLYFVGVIFDSRFVWKFEKYIEALFMAYSVERNALPHTSPLKVSHMV